jgi:hypothetical protein
MNALQKIYARLPQLQCKGLCQKACGPIGMSPLEHEAMIAFAGKPLPPTSLKCPFLAPDGKCSVYPVRPLICRLWGSVKSMRCPHGCTPGRWLSDDEAFALISRVHQLSGQENVFTHDVDDVISRAFPLP